MAAAIFSTLGVSVIVRYRRLFAVLRGIFLRPLVFQLGIALEALRFGPLVRLTPVAALFALLAVFVAARPALLFGKTVFVAPPTIVLGTRAFTGIRCFVLFVIRTNWLFGAAEEPESEQQSQGAQCYFHETLPLEEEPAETVRGR